MADNTHAGDAFIQMRNTEADEEIRKFVEKYGEDAVLDQISLEHVIINIRKRISPYAISLTDNPKTLAKNIQLRFMSTKMLEHTIGLFEGLSQIIGLLPPGTKL